MRRRTPASAVERPGELKGSPIPAELLDHRSHVWTNSRAYLDWMSARGWSLTTRDRMRADVSPERRRIAAVAAFATEIGLTGAHSPHPDWHALRRAGLL